MYTITLSWIWPEILASMAFSSLRRELESGADLLKMAAVTPFDSHPDVDLGLGEHGVYTVWRALFKKENTNYE